MQIIKQKGRRWLSGLLALIMIAGLFPATGITASAAGGGAPETIQMNKAAYASAGPFTDPNLTSSNSNYNHSAYMRVFYMQVGDNEVPGFCGNHDLDVHYKPHTWTWKDGESIRTAEGGKYMPGYEFYKRYVAEYLMSNYIRDNCGITAGNWKKWKEENQPGNDKIQNLENAIQAWADENGYGWYAYSSEWTMQLDAGDRPKGRSPAKFFCQKTHRSNRFNRSYRCFDTYIRNKPFCSFSSFFINPLKRSP